MENKEGANCEDNHDGERFLHKKEAEGGCQLMENDRRQLQTPVLLMLFHSCLKYLQSMR